MGDMISKLPDHLICQIFSHLPTKEAVKTSVLSTRWRSLWLCVSSLELNPRDFPNFNAYLSFGDMFFDSDRVSCVDNFKLVTDANDLSYFTSWINALVKRRIQHLSIRHSCQVGTYFHKMPISIYVCETLVSLTLYHLALDNTEFVSLPCLKILHLESVQCPNLATFESLVSSSPVLEDLIFDVLLNDASLYRVHSRSLKKLTLVRFSSSRFNSVPGFVIDAPLLRCLSILDNVSKSFVVNNLESIVKLDASLLFGSRVFDEASLSLRRSSIRSFLLGISRVMDMTISVETIKVIHEFSKLELVPRFGYISRLHVTLCVSDLNWLLTFLESCPNLKSLILVCYSDCEVMPLGEMNQNSFATVPECLISSLEFVEFRNSIRGHVEEMKLVRYFLENSTFLKKLTLPLHYSTTKDGIDIVKELIRIPKCSIKCEVVVFDR